MGFPVDLDWTWFIVFVLVVWAVQGGLLVRLHPEDYTRSTLLLAGVIGGLLFFSSLLGHELAHSWVARRLGIPIAGITLFIFGGVARMKAEPANPTDELKMALAGPAFSVAAAFFFYLVWGSGYLPTLWAELAWYLAVANVVVAVFNMVPAFPTDGGRALRAILWSFTGNLQSATGVASWLGQAFGYLLIFLGMLAVLRADFDGIWYILIGLFLINAAQSAYQQVQWRNAMRGLQIKDLMQREFLTVPPDISLDQAVHEYFLREPAEALPVVVEGQTLGILRVSDVREVERAGWQDTLVSSVMEPPSPDCFVKPEEDAWDVLSGAGQACQPPILVVENGRLVGTVTQETLARQLRLRMQIRT